MLAFSTKDVVEELLSVMEDMAASPRERHLLRQSLLALVRQAKIEQREDMRADVLRSAGAQRARLSRSYARLALKRAACGSQGQSELEFGGELR